MRRECNKIVQRERKKERGGERILVKKFESSRWDKNPDSCFRKINRRCFL